MTVVGKNKILTKTCEDPIVAKIHAAREAHAKKLFYELDAIFNDFKK